MGSIAPRFAALLVGAALAFGASVSFAEPAFFSDLPYAKAKASAAENEKLFFVKATAVWCGPCKMMDRTTFKDQRVIDWLNDKAVCVSVDVDDEPQLAGNLKIRAMPTTILFRGDEELARVVGYRDAEGLLSWLEEAESGRVIPAAERPRPPAHDVDARLDHARGLMRAGSLDAAAEEFAWLWENMLDHQPSMSGVRVSFMASDMSQLAKEHPAAKEVFIKLRDETEDRLLDAEKKSWEDLRDWLVLNERVLHDREPIREWIERIKDRPNAQRTFSRTSDIIDDMLIEEGQWALYGELIDDPYRDIRMFEMMREMRDQRMGNMDAAMRAQIKESEHRGFRKSVANTATALLAAGRDVDSRGVVDRALEVLDDAKMRAAIVDTAIKAGQLRPWHLDLLEGESLRKLRDKAEGMLSG